MKGGGKIRKDSQCQKSLGPILPLKVCSRSTAGSESYPHYSYTYSTRAKGIAS